ncbi:class I SAM-dependent methyltransferase [Shewanella decolorationis]|uniref:Class I SAM-dependent methyltransferase n=1 Tax=Shewanella decolorationis TaxID=256839 RepID=A0A5B8R0U6_9GAMM|nr:class I SAM-dependent methyltransferase [Shewanella decolorationis]QDZ91789.1 class I SAM-dependent methyltransferase [Shewanella decolorationis]
MSIDFYNQNASSFYASTVEVDSTSLLEQFTPYLPKGGSVLDAGCGSGRDSKRLIEFGFHVDAFDASEALATLAQQLLGKPVRVATFMQFTSTQQYDGIWACASLLHVSKASLPDTFAHLASMLKLGGAFYCSFKYGQGEVERDGRSFTHCDEVLLAELLTGLPLAIDKVWLTTDLRVGRENEQWLNAVLLKQ